jgi:hypothetical protein
MRGNTVVHDRRRAQGGGVWPAMGRTGAVSDPARPTPALVRATGVLTTHNACHGGLTRARRQGGVGGQTPERQRPSLRTWCAGRPTRR